MIRNEIGQMEGRAPTHPASKLGALTVQQGHVRHAWAQRGEGGQGDTYVSRLHMVGWKSGGGEDVGRGCGWVGWGHGSGGELI